MSSKAEQLNKLQALEAVEVNVAKALEYAGLALTELSKDKNTSKNIDSITKQFLSSLESIETELLTQINYLTTISTGQPHEGSCYGAQKDLTMAQHRMEHARERLAELDKLRLDRQRAPTSTSGVASSLQRSITFQDTPNQS